MNTRWKQEHRGYAIRIDYPLYAFHANLRKKTYMPKKPVKKRAQWTWAPAKPSSVPQSVKTKVDALAQALVVTELKPAHVLPPPPEPRFNYIVDISTKWHGRYFYFISKYACPGPNALSPFFDAPFARLEYQQNGRFSMAYMRHTGQWWPLYTDLTIGEALKIIREGVHFQP